MMGICRRDAPGEEGQGVVVSYDDEREEDSTVRPRRRNSRCMTGRVTLEPLGDGIRLLTLRRPEKLNALSWEMVEQIIDAAAEVRADRSVRALVLTGEGRGFCSGIDLGGADAVGTADGVVEVLDRQERLAEMAVALRELPQPAIAAVNGSAAGGGLALALACDARICAPSARFNVAFVRIGLSGCDVGVSYMLPRIAGFGVASEMMLTGRLVEAEEALRIGLVNEIRDGHELLDAAVAKAGEMTRNSPFALRMTKQVLEQNAGAASLRAAIELENRTQVLATRTEDMAEALSAFGARRPPDYSGR
jgi:enoyl-CoA hydratase